MVSVFHCRFWCLNLNDLARVRLARFLHLHPSRQVWGIACENTHAKEPSVPYRSVNPATGEVLKTFTEHTDEQMWNALATADKAFRDWAARPFSERSKIIGTSAQILLEKKEELSRLATLEMGKRIAESRGEVELSASIMQYFADKAEGFL